MAISLCMITKNESQHLDKCLHAVKDIVSEIIIVDTGSSDATKEIAKKYTNKIYDFKWVDDFSKARNFGIEKASKEWVLVLDADEILDASSKKHIKDLIKKKNVYGFGFEQCSYVSKSVAGCLKNNSNFESGKHYPFLIKKQLVRLFKNGKGIKFKHRVHELVEDSMRDKKLQFEQTKVQLHHLGSVKGEEVTSEKKEFYSNLIMKQLKDDPQSARYNYYAARYYHSVSDVENALKHYKKTASIDPNYKLIHSDIAKVYLQKNEMESAIKHFRKSSELNEDNPSPANNLAVLLMHKKQFSEAKSILESQMQRNPDNNALKINYQQLMREIETNKKLVAG